MNDSDAARVAEVRRVLERCVGTYQSVALSPQDAAAWLAAYDALEADRDRLRAAIRRIWTEARLAYKEAR